MEACVGVDAEELDELDPLLNLGAGGWKIAGLGSS